jgi:antagonist of KipI
MSVVVLARGFQTTVQDLGRPGYAASGVSASGAADPIALRVGNRLVGNAGTAAALEMTLVGCSLRFETDAVIALTGSEIDAQLDGAAVACWRALRVRAGGTLACGPIRGGARSYLAARGGLEVAAVLGSASTHLATGLGGIAGRALRTGDRLALAALVAHEPAPDPIDPSDVPGYRRGAPLRVTEGPQASWFTADARIALHHTRWRVAEACDRMGIRLEGASLPLVEPRELVTEGVVLGSVQVATAGSPIVLFVEHQTTGGYPKIATVASVDAARLGQLRPRDVLSFEAVPFDGAVRLLRDQAAALAGLLS